MILDTKEVQISASRVVKTVNVIQNFRTNFLHSIPLIAFRNYLHSSQEKIIQQNPTYNMAQSAVTAFRQQTRSDSMDPRNDISVQQDHYIGIDVGTGSARACIINEKGDIVGLASKNIGLWQPETGYYVRPSKQCLCTTDSLSGTIHERHLAVYLRQRQAGCYSESRRCEYY